MKEKSVASIKVLVVLAHPDLKKSIANNIIIKQIKGIKEVEIIDLYKKYPDFKIDVEAEQKAVDESHLIVFQFPFYWYSVPSLLKEWLDKVFAYDYAYGPNGHMLEGKEFLISTTVGGPSDSYKEGGYNNFTIEELLRPLEQTAKLSNMVFSTPMVSHDTFYVEGGHNKKEDVEYEARAHARRLFNFITSRVETGIF